MPADRDTGVDPRFDPVFQRGYDPSKHGARRPRSTPRHATAEAPVVPAREPAVPVVRDHAPSVPHEAGHDAGHGTHAAEIGPGHGHEAHPVTNRRNPFRLALLIASIVAIGVAVLLLYNRLGEDRYLGGLGVDVEDTFRMHLMDSAIAPLLSGGILGLVIWLAIGALRGRRPADD